MWCNGLAYLLCVPLCVLFGVPLDIDTYHIGPGGIAARRMRSVLNLGMDSASALLWGYASYLSNPRQTA